jgi:cache domain-containing protein
LLSAALLATGAIELYYSYDQTSATLVSLQREKAAGGAVQIEAFIDDIEHQIRWVTQTTTSVTTPDQRRDDYYRLLHQVEAVTDVSYLDATGHEQLHVSRLAMDVVGAGINFSADPRFRAAGAGRAYFSPVYFRRDSEPYMTIAVRESGGPVTAADVNLKFMWDVVSRIKIGKAGHAFVVDRDGILIAHPDISRVLQKTSLASLSHVVAALNTPNPNRDPAGVGPAQDLVGRRVFSAHWRIEPLMWTVFAEQPLDDALSPLRASYSLGAYERKAGNSSGSNSSSASSRLSLPKRSSMLAALTH